MGGFYPALGNFLIQQGTAVTANNNPLAAQTLGYLYQNMGMATITVQWYGGNEYQSYIARPGGIVPGGIVYTEPPPPTPELSPAEREAARAKARELLFEFLTPDERSEYENFGFFLVRGSNGGRYEVHARRGGPQNPRGAPVYRLRDNREEGGPRYSTAFCIHTYDIPSHDEVLGFKLLLEANEPEFLRTANATAIR